MSRTIPAVPSGHSFELPDHDERWLESQSFSVVPSEDRHAAVRFMNELGMPFKNGRIFKGFDSGEIPAAMISGRRCASKYDLARWALSQKYKPRDTRASA